MAQVLADHAFVRVGPASISRLFGTTERIILIKLGDVAFWYHDGGNVVLSNACRAQVRSLVLSLDLIIITCVLEGSGVAPAVRLVEDSDGAMLSIVVRF